MKIQGNVLYILTGKRKLERQLEIIEGVCSLIIIEVTKDKNNPALHGIVITANELLLESSSF